MTQELFDDKLPDDVLEHLEDPEIRARWPQALVDMLDVMADALARRIDDREQARKLATVALRALANYFGGRMQYIPRGDNLERALRDKAMWDAYDGKRATVQDLAARYRLSEQQVYAILREQRALHRRRIQPALF